MQHCSFPNGSATHLAAVHHVGMMLALAVFHGDNIPIRLAPPLLKQVRRTLFFSSFLICSHMLKLLGIPLKHPNDMELVDQSLFHNLTHCEDISGMVCIKKSCSLPFCCCHVNNFPVPFLFSFSCSLSIFCIVLLVHSISCTYIRKYIITEMVLNIVS